MIRKTVLLACGPEKAFDLFVNRAGEWWPVDRRHTKDPASAIRLERSGRFFERATDGREVELGIVRLFDAPRRLILDWYPGTGPQQPTAVEITFEAESDGTRVTVEHREGPQSTDVYPLRAPAYEKSWTLVFAAWEGAARS